MKYIYKVYSCLGCIGEVQEDDLGYYSTREKAEKRLKEICKNEDISFEDAEKNNLFIDKIELDKDITE